MITALSIFLFIIKSFEAQRVIKRENSAVYFTFHAAYNIDANAEFIRA